MESKVEFWQIYRDLYEHEVAIRNHYDGKIGVTFTILSATVGLIIYSIGNANSCVVDKRILVILQLIAICLFTLQLLFAFKAYFSFRFKYRDFPVNLIENDIKDKLLSYKGHKDIEIEMFEYISGMLFRTYKKCAETYYESNISKRKAHHMLNVITYINFLFLLMQYMLLYLGK